MLVDSEKYLAKKNLFTASMQPAIPNMAGADTTLTPAHLAVVTTKRLKADLADQVKLFGSHFQGKGRVSVISC